ncbi:MAG: hypothetical protein WC554_11800 [Clostridia bacterium]|jgi:hypothetical protein
MRTETTTRTLYKFNELSEDAQDEAIEELSDINLDYEWWTGVYEDADQVGIKITGFDTGRGNMIHGDLTQSAEDVATSIIKTHGESCDTYKTATNYLTELENIVANTPDDDPDTEDIDTEFTRAILEDYLSMLRQNYEYRGSRKSIIETIEANDYEFTADGKLS